MTNNETTEMVDMRELLKDINDVFAFHGTTEEEFLKKCEGLTPDEVGYRLEKLIVAAYNQNQLPDWEDGTTKYWPWFRMPDASGRGFSCYDYADWHTYSTVGARLVFHGPFAYEHMHDAVKKFLPQYEQSRTL